MGSRGRQEGKIRPLRCNRNITWPSDGKGCPPLATAPLKATSTLAWRDVFITTTKRCTWSGSALARRCFLAVRCSVSSYPRCCPKVVLSAGGRAASTRSHGLTHEIFFLLVPPLGWLSHRRAKRIDLQNKWYHAKLATPPPTL